MHQLAIIIAAATPTEILINQLKEAITNWEIHRNDEKLKEVGLYARLILLKTMTNGKMEEAMKVIGEMDKLNQYRKMFDGKEN